MSLKETLIYIEKFGKAILDELLIIRAMAGKVQEDNIDPDLPDSEILKKFMPSGKYSDQFINMIKELNTLEVDLLFQRVKLPSRDTAAQIKEEKVGKQGTIAILNRKPIIEK